MHEWGLCVHECSYPQNPEEGVESPRVGIAGDYELSDVGSGTKLESPQKLH